MASGKIGITHDLEVLDAFENENGAFDRAGRGDCAVHDIIITNFDLVPYKLS